MVNIANQLKIMCRSFLLHLIFKSQILKICHYINGNF
jgi:hypothetical protein